MHKPSQNSHEHNLSASVLLPTKCSLKQAGKPEGIWWRDIKPDWDRTITNCGLSVMHMDSHQLSGAVLTAYFCKLLVCYTKLHCTILD